MNNCVNTNPEFDELPSSFADRLGVIYTANVTSDFKKEIGQYFTPIEIASYMSGFSEYQGETINILDPGSGTGILSCALIEHIVTTCQITKIINLKAYETDLQLTALTEKTFNYLKLWLSERNIILNFTVCKCDFVLDNAKVLESSLFAQNINTYDIIISNPPYFKISKDDKRAIACQSIIYGQPNIYALFLAISTELLSANGEMIFITPRSFSSGQYFQALREKLFTTVDLFNVHIFSARDNAFKRDKVLQENIILKAKRLNGHIPKIKISFSNGINDLKDSTIREYEISNLLNIKSKSKILHLPVNDNDDNVINFFKKWVDNLSTYKLKISTGPVVPFRSTEFLCNSNNSEIETVPLFWLINTNKMELIHPIENEKKSQYIENSDKSKSLLIDNKNYVFLRRFSAKGDKSRLIATPYYSEFTEYNKIGVENHLNYFYRLNGELNKVEVVGLAALLNSTLFDTYFRTINGNTNVSATELREIKFPPYKNIIEIGENLISKQNITQEMIDLTINEILKFDYIAN